MVFKASFLDKPVPEENWMNWIEELISASREAEKEVGVHPKHYDVAYWFLHEGDWCDTYIGNCDIDPMNEDLPKLDHPERHFELMNDWYKFIDYDNRLTEARQLRRQLLGGRCRLE